MNGMIEPAPDFPKVVYKYRDWGFKPDREKDDYPHQRMLKDGELWMASPASFNDPFDCRISENFVDMNETEIEIYVNVTMKPWIDEACKGGQDRNSIIENLRKRLKDPEKFQIDDDQMRAPRIDLQWGVLSLSCIWDSILMWSHYGNHHRGFCIGFWEEKLRESGKLQLGGKVLCQDSFPNISPLDEDYQKKYLLQILTKAKDWDYEKEYRLFKADWNNIEKDSSWRKVIVPSDCIAEVVFGLRIEENHKKEILEICSAKQIPVFQAIQVPREYRIDRKRIL